MSNITEQLSALAAEQREEILERLLREKAQPKPRRFALSFGQQRLWVLNQMDGSSPAYNVPAALWLRGKLDVKAFERTFGEVIRRHESLRATFEVNEETGEPEQLVHPWKPFHLEIRDLTSIAKAEREQFARRLANQEAQQPFDLAKGPVLRARLLKLEAEEYVLLLTLHHIVSDMWSTGILTRELTALYEAYSKGQESPLPELPIQYADFAHWQRTRMTGGLLEQQLAYWREQLRGPRPVLELPTRPRPSTYSTRGAERVCRLERELLDALKSLSQREGVTLFMTLMAAFKVLLYRYSDQTDIIVGTPIANRNRREIEGLIGLLINTLVLRTDLSGEPSFRELLARVKEVSLQAYANQDMPFEKLVEELHPERDMSRSPLFQVMFALQNVPQQEAQTQQLSISAFPLDLVTAKFDLTVPMLETKEGLIGTWEYNTDLFDEPMIEQMIRHYENILRSVIAAPDQPISHIPILSEKERRQLLASSTHVSPSSRRGASLHELFEAQVESTPEAVALVFEGSSLTYEELNRRANKLANHLRSRGVGPDMLVGISVERSVEMVVGLLAILKAGGAYVPLDPAYPQQRLAFVLEDACITVLLTQQDMLDILPQTNVQTICLDRDWESIDLEDQHNLPHHTEGENLAYVIYTSGSTGTPKGVMVTHANVVRLFEATDPWFHFDERDVWTFFHSYAFDFSVWELWGALLKGGRLVLVPYLVSRSPQAFYELVCAEKVTVLNQTPSAFRQFMQADEASANGDGLALRLVIFGGEALDLQSLSPWFERHGDETPQLVNMYGITETTVHVTYRPLTKADSAKGTGSLIGVPIGDLQVYTLDKHLELVPFNVAGEMYVGGAGVSRGYLFRPALTAERFIPNPFCGKPGECLYRTGDLARHLSNGDLEYLGRIDHQVKIRGFRIELGEIEAALYEHPAVKDAAVVARDIGPGEKQLVAYLVSDQEQSSSVSEIRALLKRRLPEYMVPAAFVMLEQLPLTENGKVDRRALPAPGEMRPDLEAAFAAPRTLVEEVLADAWSEVLGLNQVGVDDNFFELGGDSIRSIQVLTKTQKRGVSFSLQQLFEYQTVRQLAQQLTANDFASDQTLQRQPFALISDEDRAKLPKDVEDAYPLTLLQAGMLFHSNYDLAADMYHNIGTYHLKAPLDTEILDETVQQLLARHPVLRTSFDLASFSEPLQLVHRDVAVRLEVDDISQLSPAEQENALARWEDSEKKRHFDWSCAPLLRFHIHRRSDTTFQFSMTEHHAILDGWSVASLLTELFRNYFSGLNGEADAIQSSPANLFREFVSLEHEALTSEDCQRYWREKLSDATITTLSRWPAAYREPEPSQNHVVDVPISLAIAEGLRQLARSVSVPLKSVLLAAHIRVMSFISGQSDLVTGLVTHGRPEDIDGERALGLFLNTLPARLKIAGGTWTDLAREVFEAERELMPFRYYPMAQIQQDQGGQPLFETVFNFTNFHVFQTLQELDELEVLEAKLYAETNLTFWANFSLDLDSSKIILILNGDARSLSEQQMEAIGGYYARTLEAMAHEPDASLVLHSPLSAAERKQMLLEWNDNKAERPRENAVSQLFEAQVERTPDEIAIVCADEKITYRELNRRANKLARYLRSLGVGPEVRVGICTGRSIEMVVGLLGILKAGGAYVPLDMAYPKDRLAFMLEDAQVSALVVQQRVVEALPRHHARIVCLDSDWETISREDEKNLSINVTANNLAYVIYTSGSTGRPKGVAIEHRSALTFLHWARTVFAPADLAGMLASTSICFDLSVFELFAPLSWGGKIFLVENALHLATLDDHEEVTLINTVPSAMAELVNLKAVPAAVRTVNLAGEALHNKLVQQVYEQGTIEQVFNLYGPSEDTTYSTFALIRRGQSEEPLIGRPIVNTQVYLLDAWQQPVPIGAAGELYIGGEGLARGYLNCPEMTAEKFVPDPFGGELGARLYRTGDLARYLPDGNLEFLGRIDHQVKIRGFRIELGEIEAALGIHPAVREAVVLACDDPSGDRRLVAYVVANQQSDRINDLRGFLKERLPDYMVPSTFVWLNGLPLTPNGKVDRPALRALDKPVPQSERVITSPRDLLEFHLTQIWENLLNKRPISITDNFFDLGGHSLLAVRLVAQIKHKLKYNLPLSALVQAADIENLAHILRQQTESKPESLMVALQPSGSKQPFFCIHPIGGNILCYMELARCIGTDRPFYGLQATRLNGQGNSFEHIEEMAAYYIDAIRDVQPAGPYLVGGWSFGGVVAVEIARQLKQQNNQTAHLALFDAWAPARSRKAIEDGFSTADLMARFLTDTAGISSKELSVDHDLLRQLDKQEQLRCILEQATRHNILPADMEVAQLALLFEIFERNARAFQAYLPPSLEPGGRIILYRASDGKNEVLDGPMLGWDEFILGQLEVRNVPGDHYTMLASPNARELAGHLRTYLDSFSA